MAEVGNRKLIDRGSYLPSALRHPPSKPKENGGAFAPPFSS